MHGEYEMFGPTLEMLSSDENHRGRNYALTLNNDVENWLRAVWHNRFEEGKLSLMCYKIQGGVLVEEVKGKPINDKLLFYRHLGYNVSQATPTMKDTVGLIPIGPNMGEDGWKEINNEHQASYKRKIGLEFCKNCFTLEKKPSQFKKCKGCKRVKYCSEQCTNDDWKMHKYVCRVVQGKTGDVPKVALSKSAMLDDNFSADLFKKWRESNDQVIDEMFEN